MKTIDKKKKRRRRWLRPPTLATPILATPDRNEGTARLFSDDFTQTVPPLPSDLETRDER